MDSSKINCADISSNVFQLSIILYPPELFNEKFLIKIRDCVLKLNEGHPLKRWLQSISNLPRPSEKEVQTQGFLSEILNSQFNLITDIKMKNQIIEILSEISEDTIADKVLKSYLYLMIGNVTRSDNILIQITQRPPIDNWKNFKARRSLYTKLSITNFDQILLKFQKHPTDRRAFQLFVKYLKAFYNETSLLNSVSSIKDDLIAQKLDLKYIEKISPHLVHYLRVERYKESNRLLKLKDPKEFPYDEQSYWIWPFIDVDSVISDDFYPEIERIEKDDQLWFIYLMRNEKLVDLYQKKNNKGFILGRRKFLREQLKNRPVFMLSLYKLIELGDIDEDLVLETVKFLTNE